jgi:Mg2+-importing ATPase
MTAITLQTAATLPVDAVLQALETSANGLDESTARSRRNSARTPKARSRPIALTVLARQFSTPFLILLVVTALLALVLHDAPDAAIIVGIVVLSVALSFATSIRRSARWPIFARGFNAVPPLSAAQRAGGFQRRN